MDPMQQLHHPHLKQPKPRLKMDDHHRRERRMALDALEKDAAKVWSDLPDAYRLDKECILKALKSPTLPPKSQFERQFPQKLRFDKQVVLAFCARSDFYELYHDRHLYVPGCLMHDKDVMLAYCQKIPRSLQECSDNLCNDRDVVLAAIQLDGLELQYASRALQQDKEIVKAACRKDGRALEFCPPGPVRTELVMDREFMLAVLRQHGGPMLRLVPEPLRHDRELLLEALKHGMRFRYCPSEYQTDRPFVLEALARRAGLYLEMNRTTQAQLDIAYAAICSQTSNAAVQKRVLNHAPELKSRRAVALAICQRGELDDMKHYIAAECPMEFKNDREIMLGAIQRDCKLFAYASPTLKRDTEIIMAAIDEESAADVLAAVGQEALRQHPQIVVRAISVYPVRHMRVLCTHVPEELWTHHRPIAVAYIVRNGRVLDAFEPMLLQDQELALLVAEHAGPDFGRVGDALKNDLAFMKQAVDRNGRVLRFASPELRQNLDLVVRAVANHAHAIVHSSTSTAVAPQVFPRGAVAHANAAANNNNNNGWNTEQVKEFVQQKLDLHQVFVEEFLRGIAIARPHLPPAQRSSLTMLDRGVETSQAFKQLIAEFLGVPIGTELKILRTALINLTQPVPETATHDREAQLYMVDRLARRRMHRAQRRGVILNPAAPEDQHPQQLLLQPDDRPAAMAGIRFGLFLGADGGGPGGGAEDDHLPHPLRRRRGPWNRAGAVARIGAGVGGGGGVPPLNINGAAANPPLRAAAAAAEEDMEEDDDFIHPFAQIPRLGELPDPFMDGGLFEEWDMMGHEPEPVLPAVVARAAPAANQVRQRAAAAAVDQQQQQDMEHEMAAVERMMMMDQEDDQL